MQHLHITRLEIDEEIVTDRQATWNPNSKSTETQNRTHEAHLKNLYSLTLQTQEKHICKSDIPSLLILNHIRQRHYYGQNKPFDFEVEWQIYPRMI